MEQQSVCGICITGNFSILSFTLRFGVKHGSKEKELFGETVGNRILDLSGDFSGNDGSYVWHSSWDETESGCNYVGISRCHVFGCWKLYAKMQTELHHGN